LDSKITHHRPILEFFSSLLERLLCEIGRCTRVAGAFPDGESALNLAAAWPRQDCTLPMHRRSAYGD